MLQGVSKPGHRISDEEKKTIADWIVDNANRYWLPKGGPLRPPEEGGAHVIVVSSETHLAFHVKLTQTD